MITNTAIYQRVGDAQVISNPLAKARIIPDETYPDMHRVRWPDGKLSDMANLTRASDAAARFNESLDREYRGRQKLSETPYVSLNPGKAA